MRVYRNGIDSKTVTGVLLMVLFEDSRKSLVISDCRLSNYFSTDTLTLPFSYVLEDNNI